jgi:hypothetical protein
MMRFEKKGLIYCPSGEKNWMQHSFLTPAPVLMGDTIRIFGGIRDSNGVSRIGFIDVSAENPSEILYVHQEPVVDIGEDGCFDDNGVILGSVLHDGEKWRMYYIGFQHVKKVKFFAFTGLAESADLLNFKRKFVTPVADRKDWMRFINCIHTVIKEEDKYRIFYAVGNRWVEIGGVKYPSYSVYYTESKNGHNFDYKINPEIVKITGSEYRIGRPTVYKLADKYIMFCTYDTIDKQYGVAYFESNDCTNWRRMDEKIETFKKSESGWDSEMACYPALLHYKDRTYVFYNGNGMGKSGVGYAILK